MLEQLRDQRLLKALNDKGPKLKIAKAPSTTTILVLENADIALTNEGGVSEAIDRIGQNLPFMPDDIYLVGTYIAGHFYVSQVRKAGKPCLIMGHDGAVWDFPADALTEI
jgi:hypothetical protein